MRYIEVEFSSNPHSEDIYDILSANLSEIGFESFVQSEDNLLAYIEAEKFSTLIIEKLIEIFPLDVTITYSFKSIEDKNWNEEWEKNFFMPIIFEDKCIIYSSFNTSQEKYKYEYQIQIDPKMSFGTGHHQTTGLMINEILKLDFNGRDLLDMGCGTAILAILASMRGAKNVLAIDIDEWAYNNAIENVKLNNRDNIEVQLGDADLLDNTQFDIILANINRNILLDDIPSYTKVLNKGGTLIMSGFYQNDIPMISERCMENGLVFSHFSEKDNWVSVVFNK